MMTTWNRSYKLSCYAEVECVNGKHGLRIPITLAVEDKDISSLIGRPLWFLNNIHVVKDIDYTDNPLHDEGSPVIHWENERGPGTVSVNVFVYDAPHITIVLTRPLRPYPVATVRTQ